MEQLSKIDVEIATCAIMKHFKQRYKREFKFEYDLKQGDELRINEMIYRWGYKRAMIACLGAIYFYKKKWKSDKFKWLSINQVFTFIGEGVLEMYDNKEYKPKIPKVIF
ncbi:hypothetical protein BKP35_10395 [Anaerobacillus arseniciselenatis]|uniref:Uncharacterized protein n=1 Tax=Anaerobacillus arseniciselenatis TaxID=85682 RepID=A0A1S2LL71_9BACI|nr:hypothetical protein [Anaerobacillus arseniciselenatis]OIJ12960.1 hypothetical protein BKP35_10395 [Anaerobacillus arseniciselenatis]